MLIQRMMGCLALMAVTASAGCGTMANLDGRPLPTQAFVGQETTKPFGGVRRDIIWMKSGRAPDNLKYAADLPLSFLGDLVTLPKTVIGSNSDSLLHESGPIQAGTSVAPQAQP